MQLKKFSAKNAGPFGSVELDLARMRGIWTITGSNLDISDDASNGVGKTTLYDIIYYTMTGSSMEGRSLNDLVNDEIVGSRKEKMICELIVDDLRISRGHKPKVMTVEQVSEDADTLPKDLTQTQMQSALWQAWGMNEPTLQFIMRFGGGETGLVSYAKASAEFKRRLQDCLIQADRISSCLKTARTLANKLERDIAVQLNSKTNLEERVQDARDDLASLERRAKDEEQGLREEIETCKEKLKEYEAFDFEEAYRIDELWVSEEDKMMKVRAKKKHLSADQKKDEDELKHIEEEIDGLRKKEKALEEKREDDRPFKKDMDLADSEAGRLRRELERMASVSSERERIERENAENERVLGEREAEKKRLQKELDEIDAEPEPKNVKAFQEEITEATKAISSLEASLSDAERALKNMEKRTRISTVEQKIEALDTRVRRLNKDLAKVKEEIDDARNLKPGSICQTCGSDVTEKTMESLVASLTSEASQIEEEVSGENKRRETLSIELKEAKEAERAYVQQQEDVDSIKDELRSARNRKAKADSDLAAMQQALIRYETQQGKRQMIERTLRTTTSMYDGAIKKRDSLRRELASLGSDDEKLRDKIREQEGIALSARKNYDRIISENREIAGEIAEVQGIVRANEKTASNLESRIKFRRREIDDLSDEIKRLTKILDDLCDENGEEPLNKASIDQKMSKKQSLEDMIARLTKSIEANNTSDLIEEKANKLKRLESELEEAGSLLHGMERDRPYYDFWIKAFGSEGIRALAMKDIVPVLNDEARRVMTFLEGQRVDVRFDDELNLEFRDWNTGEETSWSRCSGGMKKRVNIAIACAFRETMRLSSGADLDLFIVDESCESLDAPGMIGFADLLQEIAQDSAVWVISHNIVLREAVDRMATGNIHVEMQDKKSQVHVSYN